MFLVRPVGVFISAIKSGLRFNEKLFISWVGPRGIVAAGIASLFGTKLVAQGEPGAEFITPLVFMIVLGTVLLNATTARYFAKIVGVYQKRSKGIMIVGASKVSRLIAMYLKSKKRYVVLIDTNQNNIAISKSLGLEAMEANIFNDQLTDSIELNSVGYLLALTGNDTINKKVIDKLEDQFGEHGTYRMITEEEYNKVEELPKQGIFSYAHDFSKYIEVASKYPAVSEVTLNTVEDLSKIIEIIKKDKFIVPLFLTVPKGPIQVISSYDVSKLDFAPSSKLAYLGKPIDVEVSSLTE